MQKSAECNSPSSKIAGVGRHCAKTSTALVELSIVHTSSVTFRPIIQLIIIKWHHNSDQYLLYPDLRILSSGFLATDFSNDLNNRCSVVHITLAYISAKNASGSEINLNYKNYMYHLYPVLQGLAVNLQFSHCLGYCLADNVGGALILTN